jgi:ABC-2 type transport system ATP-binding protein
LRKSFCSDFLRRRRPVLRGIDLELEPGETLAYLGHNGAGKTTTVKAILGLIKPDAGEVSVFGHPAGDPQGLAKVGYLPENPYFYDHLSGREFLALIADLHGLPARVARRRIDEVLAMVGMQKNAMRRMRNYSRGMLQRLGLAQALVNQPELLILDEPLSGLDPVGRVQVRNILAQLKDRGTTIFMSSHILSDVESLADRAAILKDGVLKRIVRMEDLVAGNAAKVVSCRQLPESAARRLDEQGHSLHRQHDRATIEVEHDEDLPRVLATLQASGAKILRMEPRRCSLEDLFLREIMDSKDLPQHLGDSQAERDTDNLVEAVRDVQEVQR